MTFDGQAFCNLTGGPMKEMLLATNDSQATLGQHPAVDLQVAAVRCLEGVLHLRQHWKDHDTCKLSAQNKNGMSNQVCIRTLCVMANN